MIIAKINNVRFVSKADMMAYAYCPLTLPKRTSSANAAPREEHFG